MWMCVHCRSAIEDDEWETCWKCNRTRDVSAAGYEEEQKEILKLDAETYRLRELLSRCSRCSGAMKFAGMRDLRHGYDGVLSHIERELLALYHCERCGKVEWFKPDVGAEFRGGE